VLESVQGICKSFCAVSRGVQVVRWSNCAAIACMPLGPQLLQQLKRPLPGEAPKPQTFWAQIRGWHSHPEATVMVAPCPRTEVTRSARYTALGEEENVCDCTPVATFSPCYLLKTSSGLGRQPLDSCKPSLDREQLTQTTKHASSAPQPHANAQLDSRVPQISGCDGLNSAEQWTDKECQ
jgi:hypothetical protein